MTTTTEPAGEVSAAALLSVPAMVNTALDRVRAEQQRAGRLLVHASKCRRLSALYEHEARLWTLLVRHTATPVYRRAAIEAHCAARARARECAELARHWDTTPEPGVPDPSIAPVGAR